jgi:hypothetical protein
LRRKLKKEQQLEAEHKMFTKQLFISKLTSRNVRLILYNAFIRTTVTCAYETWVLKENMITKTDNLRKNDYEENVWSYKNRIWLLED